MYARRFNPGSNGLLVRVNDDFLKEEDTAANYPSLFILYPKRIMRLFNHDIVSFEKVFRVLSRHIFPEIK